MRGRKGYAKHPSFMVLFAIPAYLGRIPHLFFHLFIHAGNSWRAGRKMQALCLQLVFLALAPAWRRGEVSLVAGGQSGHARGLWRLIWRSSKPRGASSSSHPCPDTTYTAAASLGNTRQVGTQHLTSSINSLCFQTQHLTFHLSQGES